jgi:hypothetical protein
MKTTDPRLCSGCGQRKALCPCWAAGAGDEAVRAREGYDLDELALMDYIRASMDHNQSPTEALTVALLIEMASEKNAFRCKLRVIRRLLSPLGGVRENHQS